MIKIEEKDYEFIEYWLSLHKNDQKRVCPWHWDEKGDPSKICYRVCEPLFKGSAKGFCPCNRHGVEYVQDVAKKLLEFNKELMDKAILNELRIR